MQDCGGIEKKGGLLSLTPSEWKILSAMVKYPKKVFTRDDLIDLVFGPDFDGYDRVIDTHMQRKMPEEMTHTTLSRQLKKLEEEGLSCRAISENKLSKHFLSRYFQYVKGRLTAALIVNIQCSTENLQCAYS